ncbi:MAG: hypothetical protein Q8R02_11685 [Hyphomonadaceae bacterium]|nr:hypothetical protein [Hyphomonadaceae bacterium]
MLVEVFRRLHPFGAVEDYRYVGFGSVWFSDFSLVHRTLGVTEMLSIEKAKAQKPRFDANRPFNIKMDYRAAGDALKSLKWSTNHFVWLDYDGVLDTEILKDVRLVASKANSGSALIVSTQCNQAKEVSDADNEPSGLSATERFKQTFGNARVGANLGEEDLYGWPFGTLCKKIILEEVNDALKVRNLGGADKLAAEVICEIDYQDGAKMTTVALLFWKTSDAAKLAACGFSSLDFLPSAGKRVFIDLPKLTARELRQLEAQLPLASGDQLNLGAIPASDASKFTALYRYFPNFAVTEV